KIVGNFTHREVNDGVGGVRGAAQNALAHRAVNVVGRDVGRGSAHFRYPATEGAEAADFLALHGLQRIDTRLGIPVVRADSRHAGQQLVLLLELCYTFIAGHVIFVQRTGRRLRIGACSSKVGDQVGLRVFSTEVGCDKEADIGETFAQRPVGFAVTEQVADINLGRVAAVGLFGKHFGELVSAP